MSKIWNEEGELDYSRFLNLGIDQIKKLLRTQTVQFVGADIGQKLKWIPIEDCFSLWESYISASLVENPDNIDLDQFPDGKAIIASQWDADGKPSIILCEIAH